ncbi:hypothetical protein [Candidatus Uabimicrobium amorphum]|uniref:3-keto-disaccharide hydrolase domain-containing protein n=1 Tax=Uabimicrobium amorphum TaxID=2596890 RepID=A0A5S9INJ7_UABAM|nr:hypothetical protein [Candidatus Uabimicrobium amorphum]BBM84807.1 hypothetical protein UABAM_03168 [Candidatus Uabimicrobium amorphum]
MRYVFCVVLFLSVTFSQELPLPPRPQNAASGSEFIEMIVNLPLEKREEVIFQEIVKGNVPEFLRKMIPVTVQEGSTTVRYYVTCDYMCVGDNSDYFLTPMTPLLAQRLADYMDCSLPTTKMVDDIWAQAVVKMSPRSIPPAPDMTTVPVFARHNRMVYAQRLEFLPQYPLGSLVAGNKKDVVVTTRLVTTPKRVAIYGWHRTNGKNIQPLYLGHIDTYADYSHGIRFVLNSITLNGQQRKMREVLGDTKVSGILSKEGKLLNSRYPIAVSLPVKESFPAYGRDLCMWQDKFTSPETVAVKGESVATICDPSGGVDTISLKTTQKSMYIAADIYCEYRPELTTQGFERVGIFVRDNGNGVFEHSSYKGSCYGMAWDSHDGRLWCFRVDSGKIVDLSEVPIYMANSQWRTMKIETKGSDITFILDGKIVTSIKDTKYDGGSCGVGYHEYFSDNKLIKGTRVKSFSADVLD